MTEEGFTRRTVTVVMAVIATLAFIFSFGNVWALALRLGVPHPIAPLVAPMVDLSVVGLLVALRFLALHGVPENELKAGTRLLHLCGLLTLALNTAESLLTGRYGRACLDTVAPLLLLGWGRVGPSFLAQFHTLTQPPPLLEATTGPVHIPVAETVPAGVFAPAAQSPTPAPVTDPTPAPDPAPVTPTIEAPEPNPAPAQATAPATTAKTTATGSRTALPAALLNAARRIADTHHTEHGQPITAAQLKTRMGVALPVATAALAQL